MLASVLPGVRDVRVPLASGLLWLFAAWLVLEPRFPDEAPESGTFLARIHRLVDFFGTGGAVGAILFSAYLVGIILAFERVRFGQVPGKVTQLMASSTYDHLKSHLAQDLQSAVKEMNQHGEWKSGKTDQPLAAALMDSPASWRDDRTKETLSTEIAYDLYREEAALANRLRMQSNQEVYQSYDAKVAEANFRQAVSLPLGVLIVVLAINVSWLWFAALVVPVLLLILSGSARKEARSELVEAVIGKLIESTTVKHFREAASNGDIPVLHASLKMQRDTYVPHESSIDDEPRRVIRRSQGRVGPRSSGS
ncbi:hypothetical protein ACI798_20525 [Geodermatophilus sp. SYSU D01045]